MRLITTIFCGILLWALLVFSVALISAEPTVRRELRVRWNANQEPDLTGYRIREGTNSGAWQREIDVGLSTTNRFTISSRPAFLTVVAYNTSGFESDPSKEIRVDWPDTPSGVAVEVTVVVVSSNTVTIANP